MSTSLANNANTLGSDYSQLFATYTQRSAGLALRQLQTVVAVPPNELRSQALLTLGYTLRFPQTWPSAKALLLTLAPMMEQAGQWDEWLPFLERGIARSQALDDRETLAELQICLGNLRRRQGELSQASALLERAAEHFLALNKPARYAAALNRLANVARTQHNYAAAQSLLDAALENLPATDPERAYTYYIRGQIAIESLAWPAALDALTQAKALAEAHDDSRIRALALLNLGRVYERQHEFATAIKLYEQAQTIFERNQDPVNLAVTQMNLGLVYMYAEQPAEALHYYRQAESTLRKLGDRRYLAMVYNNLGMLYRDLDKWAEAEQAMHASATIWRELGDPLACLNVEGNLGIAYVLQGRYAEAAKLFERLFQELEAFDQGLAERQKLHQGWLPYLQEAQEKSGAERTSGPETLSSAS